MIKEKFLVKNLRTNETYANSAKIAENFFDRLLGLMFKKNWELYDGLVLSPCNSIHTCFMKFKIDVIFLDKSNKVISFFLGLSPWRLTPIYFKAVKVIELPENAIKGDIQKGDSIEVICIK